MRYILTFIALIFVFQVVGQDRTIKQFNRTKWKELINEIDKKRFEPREKNRQSKSQTETEYNDLESGDYNSGTESGDGDGGIYDEGNGSNNGTSDDDLFFDESKDRNGNGEGKNPFNEKDLEDIDPKYEDNENGNNSGNGNQNGGEYNSYKDKSNRDVYYDKNKPEPNPSTINRENDPLINKGGGGNSTWLLIIMIIILAIAVVYMILVSFGEKNKKVNIIETTEDKFENLTITKSELELALEAALKNKDFRGAVRIYFIAIIKEMKDRSWIKWEKKKTNHNYINEINGKKQQPDFITATRAFEIVWYGNRTLAENEYYQLEPLFKKLLSSIHA